MSARAFIAMIRQIRAKQPSTEGIIRGTKMSKSGIRVS